MTPTTRLKMPTSLVKVGPMMKQNLTPNCFTRAINHVCGTYSRPRLMVTSHELGLDARSTSAASDEGRIHLLHFECDIASNESKAVALKPQVGRERASSCSW